MRLLTNVLKYKFELIIGFIVLLVFMMSGSVFSGYHLMDNHWVLGIDKGIKNDGIFSTLYNYLKDDISGGRFRTYYILRIVVETYILGPNFVLISFLILFEAIFYTILFYRVALLLKFEHLSAFFFALFIIIGEQSISVIMLGSQESRGLCLLALLMYFSVKSSTITVKKNIFKTLFFILTILCSQAKESFVLIIPAAVFFHIWIYSENQKISFLSSIRKNLILLIGIFILIITELILFKLLIKNEFGYIGFGWNGFSINRFLLNYTILFSKTSTWLVILLYLTYKIDQNSKKILIHNLRIAVIFVALLTIPEVYLYMRTYIWERYLIPSTVGIAFINFYIFDSIIKNHKVKFTRPDYIKFVIALLFSGFIFGFSLNLLNSKIIIDHLLKFSISLTGVDLLARRWDLFENYIFRFITILPSIIITFLLIINLLRKRFVSIVLLISLILITFLLNLFLVWHEGKRFADEGFAINGLMKNISEITNPTDGIVLIGNKDLLELPQSMKIALNYTFKRSNVVYLTLYPYDNEILRRDINEIMKNPETKAKINNAKVIVTFPLMDEIFSDTNNKLLKPKCTLIFNSPLGYKTYIQP
ncbi:MAG: hypothetical protein NT007_17390 [Candidatus Kapabacteria bacterium]|nr:hypothetical protein [Candidatus Kapabacteria bacterium]